MSKKIILGKALALLPLPVIQFIARTAAKRMFRKKQGYSYKTAATNIEKCFPELSAQVQSGIVQDTLINNATTMAETPYIWFRPKSKIQSLYGEVINQEAFISARDNPNGCLLLCPHIGNWEMMGYYLGQHSTNTSMYLPSKQGSEIDTAIRAARSRFGSTLLPATAAGVKGLFQALKRGELVSILPDQSPGDDSGMVFSTFFEQSAATITLPVKLAMRPNVKILLGYSIRNFETGKFDMGFESLDALNSVESVESGAAVMNAAIENLVRRYPDQYLWTYKRFKRQPDSESQPFYH
jgi:KDO2-lipid IV(A) lauroyltransferase